MTKEEVLQGALALNEGSKNYTVTFGGRESTEVEREEFRSEDVKKVVRDYLDSCGYKRTNKGFWRKLFGR